MKLTCKKCGYQSDDEVDFMRCINENMTDTICNDCCEEYKTPKDVLKLIDEFKDKILNANTKSRNYIEIVDFKYQIQELKARIEEKNDRRKFE